MVRLQHTFFLALWNLKILFRFAGKENSVPAIRTLIHLRKSDGYQSSCLDLQNAAACTFGFPVFLLLQNNLLIGFTI